MFKKIKPVLLRVAILLPILMLFFWNYKRIWGYRYFERYALLVLVISGVIWVLSGRWRQFVVISVAYLLIAYGPLDFIRTHSFDVPRIMPYMIGLPSPEARKAAERGEVWLHGCVYTGREPKWVIVW